MKRFRFSCILSRMQSVSPQKGRAVFWPLVLDEDPSKKDERTKRQTLPIRSGSLCGVNVYIHQRNFQEPWAKACL